MLTRRQRECLLFIQAEIRRGHAPSIRDVAAHMGSEKSVWFAQKLLLGLEERGFISREMGGKRAKRRSIRVLRPIPVDEVFKWCDESKKLKPLNAN